VKTLPYRRGGTTKSLWIRRRGLNSEGKSYWGWRRGKKAPAKATCDGCCVSPENRSWGGGGSERIKYERTTKQDDRKKREKTKLLEGGETTECRLTVLGGRAHVEAQGKANGEGGEERLDLIGERRGLKTGKGAGTLSIKDNTTTGESRSEG